MVSVLRNKTVSAHLMAILTVLIWGTTFISTKVLLAGFTPIEIMIFRFVIGYAALWILCPKLLPVKSLKEEIYFVLAGISGLTLYYLLENVALTYTLASNVGVIVSVAPMFTAILAQLTLKEEKLGGAFFIGFAVAIAGIILIGFNGGFVLHLNPLGDILAFLAALAWGFYSILCKRIGSFGYSVILMTRRIFLYGILFMIPCAFSMGFSFDFGRLKEPASLLNVLYLGLGASAVCFAAWNRAINILGAVKTSAYIYAVPAVSVAAAALILKEPVSAVSILGTGLTLTGLMLSEWKNEKIKQLEV